MRNSNRIYCERLMTVSYQNVSHYDGKSLSFRTAHLRQNQNFQSGRLAWGLDRAIWLEISKFCEFSVGICPVWCIWEAEEESLLVTLVSQNNSTLTANAFVGSRQDSLFAFLLSCSSTPKRSTSDRQLRDARSIQQRYGTPSNWSASVAGTGSYYTPRRASNRRHDDGCPALRRCIQAMNCRSIAQLVSGPHTAGRSHGLLWWHHIGLPSQRPACPKLTAVL